MTVSEPTQEDLREWAKDMYLAYECGHDHFNAGLLKLIAKSDPAHKRLLMLSFPAAVLVYEMWYAAPSPGAFYRTFGVGEQLYPKSDEKKRWDMYYAATAS